VKEGCGGFATDLGGLFHPKGLHQLRQLASIAISREVWYIPPGSYLFTWLSFADGVQYLTETSHPSVLQQII
jgi:hypothetical protein